MWVAGDSHYNSLHLFLSSQAIQVLPNSPAQWVKAYTSTVHGIHDSTERFEFSITQKCICCIL